MSGWLPLYMLEEDVPLLHERLDADPEVAFIIRDGPECWRAVWQVDDLRGKMKLWHVPGGPLPLLHAQGEDTPIDNPFAGWREERPGLDRTLPYFGPACQVSLVLRVWVPGWRGLPPHLLPLSSLEWQGRMSARSRPEPTRRWWSRMRQWVGRHARRVTRQGPLLGPHADVWALPAALRALQSGMERADNPWLGA
jgi:hypothetical protein